MSRKKWEVGKERGNYFSKSASICFCFSSAREYSAFGSCILATIGLSSKSCGSIGLKVRATMMSLFAASPKSW